MSLRKQKFWKCCIESTSNLHMGAFMCEHVKRYTEVLSFRVI